MKILRVLIVAVAILMIAPSAMAWENLFSYDPGDYCLTIEVNDVDDTFKYVIFGKFAEGKSLADLQTYGMVYGITFPEKLAEISSFITDDKLVIWSRATGLPASCIPAMEVTVPLKSECEELAAIEGQSQKPFKCSAIGLLTPTEILEFEADGKTAEELKVSFIAEPAKVLMQIAAAGSVYYGSPEVAMDQLFGQCGEDVNENGVPDAFDAEAPIESEEEEEEEIPDIAPITDPVLGGEIPPGVGGGTSDSQGLLEMSGETGGACSLMDAQSLKITGIASIFFLTMVVLVMVRFDRSREKMRERARRDKGMRRG